MKTWLMNKTARKPGISELIAFALFAIVITISWLNFLPDFFTNCFGTRVQCIVIANEKACEYKNKHILILDDGETKKIRLYTIRFLRDRYPLNQPASFRKSNYWNRIVPEKNAHWIRLVIFTFFMVVLYGYTIHLLRKRFRPANPGQG